MDGPGKAMQNRVSQKTCRAQEPLSKAFEEKSCDMLIKKQIYWIGCLVLGNSFFLPLFASPPDTIPSYLLHEVEVQAQPAGPKAPAPLQVLDAADLKRLPASQVSDAVKFFSGVQVKDYGGTGGLKTVSVRSLGASYTNVAYDGIPVSDYQTGQTDLGRFSLENVKMISLQTGDDPVFQTAQMQSLAGTLNIVTQTFSPEERAKNKLRASLKAGSFGSIHPALWFGRRISSVLSADVSADYIYTKGDYPFRQTVGDNNRTRRLRNNSDVETLKLETNLTGHFNTGGRLRLKVYAYDSDRGLPGAAIYYNDYSGERLKDRIFFTQARYTQPLHEKIDFQANAKFNFSAIHYTNDAYAGGRFTNRYYQREYYLNATFRYTFSPKLSISWANDGTYGNFDSRLMHAKGIFPARTSWLSALAGKYETASFNATAKLLNMFVRNESRPGKTLADYRHLSPYAGISVRPVRDIPLRLRAFYKNTFRLPTFGDLYYSTQPAANLKPENAHQYNAGLTFTAPVPSLTLDVYRYAIRNKIVAVPRGSMFIWSVQNYGKVHITGIDLTLSAQAQTGTPFRWLFSGTYTYQEALNKTAGSPNYNKRLPYTSRHSASGVAGLETPWVELNYTLLYCGKRYYGEDNRPESQLKPFVEQGVSLQRTFRWTGAELTLSAECMNLLNVQYEIVNAYPMPGRSFRFGIKLNRE
jgi:outer membrane cobalamin receptor